MCSKDGLVFRKLGLIFRKLDPISLFSSLSLDAITECNQKNFKKFYKTFLIFFDKSWVANESQGLSLKKGGK